MAIHKTEAIVLERRDYRETSYLLNFFTYDFGKIHAQAKGAKRRVGKFGTSFLPLSHNKIIFYETTKTDLHIISQADLIEHFDNIDKHIERFTYATYFLELVNTTMGLGDKNSDVFHLLVNSLKLLNKQDTPADIVQIFEIKFLNFSGFKPRLDCCVSCGQRVIGKSKFSYVLGGLLCARCFFSDPIAQSIMPGTVATVNYIEQRGLDKIANFKISRAIKTELGQILRSFIDFHLGGQFKSLEFLKKVRFAYV